MTKPPYRVPTMLEIAQIAPNGFNAVSTFSGCGGSSLGYKMAGFKVLWASEFIPAAQETYRANHPGTILDVRDVRDVKPEDILAATGLGVGEIDLFDGSPPCASFSTAGIREEGWGRVKKYCVAPTTKILTADLRWVEARLLRLGAKLVGFEEQPTTARGRRFATTTLDGLSIVYRPSVRISFEDGSSVVCSEDHRWLAGSPGRGKPSEGAGRNQRWRYARDLKIGHNILKLTDPWEEEMSKEAGWLAGMFDGEGCLTRPQLSVAQVPGLVRERLIETLRARRYEVCDSNSIYVNGGIGERLRLLGTIRPYRLLAKAESQWDGVGVSSCRRVRISGIEKLGEIELVALSTAHKTFVAEGFLSHNSDTKQRTDDLFFEFARLVKGCQPKVFVAENVAGLTVGVAKEMLGEGQIDMFETQEDTILHTLMDCGYRVGFHVLNAADLGVPQSRRRVIFVGIRKDIATAWSLEPIWPRPIGHFFTIRDAFEAPIPPEFDVPGVDISAYAIGAEWERLRPGEQSEKYFSLIRTHPDEICPCVCASHGGGSIASITHFAEKRKFSIGELRRLSAFPDDFKLTGTYEQQWERLGRAVPPVMMSHVAATIRDEILGRVIA